MGNVNMEASQINYRGGQKKMSVEEALKNTSGEAAAIAQLQTDVLNLNSNKANQITIAPFFSAEASYDPGDLVYYNGLSYRCVNAHEGEWDADDFAATTISGELDTLRSGLTSLHKVEIIPLTMPSDLSSKAIGSDVVVPFATGYEGWLIIGVYVYVFGQNRGILGYFHENTILNNDIVLMSLNKQFLSRYDSASGFALVVNPS